MVAVPYWDLKAWVKELHRCAAAGNRGPKDILARYFADVLDDIRRKALFETSARPYHVDPPMPAA